MFGFIFTGTEAEFRFLKMCADEKIPNSELQVEKIDHENQEIHCLMTDDIDRVFEMGMLLSVCYEYLEKIN